MSAPKGTVQPRGSFVCATSGERLDGDFNNNGSVEQGDLDLVLLGWGSDVVVDAWVHDLPSGAIDQGELDKVLLGWGNSRPDDVDCPVIDAALANDTAPLGEANSDGVTFDPAIGGSITDQSQITSLLVSVDSTLPEDFTEAVADVQPDGTFELSRARLEEIGGGPLNDGLHTVRLLAADVHGFVSATFSVPFMLDTVAPPITFELDPAFDSNPVGDQTTGFAAVTFTGDSEPDVLVQTSEGAIQTMADAAGIFALTGVPLIVGANHVTLAAYDLAGNENLQTQTITRFFNEPPTLTIDEGHMIEAGGSMTISTDMLSATDPDGSPEQIVYTMLQDGFTGMLTGYLAFAAAPDEAITSFTQADLDAGRVILRDGVGGMVLPEIVADSFSFSVSDGQGGETGSRSLLFLRELPEAGPDDDVTVWRPSDSVTFLDAGVGDDAFVLRGQDSADEVMVRPSPDGTQIVVTVGGNETVTLDGFEDIYFIMGNGDNEVGLSGDFSGSDLSPSTVFYQGGGDGDIFNCLDVDLVDCEDQARVDVVAHFGGGNNLLQQLPIRASFVTGLSGSDIYNVHGVSGFKQHLFPGGGNSRIQVTRGNAIVELDDFFSSTNQAETGPVLNSVSSQLGTSFAY